MYKHVSKPWLRHGPFDILGGPGLFWKKISLLWFWLKKINLLNGKVKKIICLQQCNSNSLIGWFETSKSKIFFWLASLARLLLTNLNYIYCPRVMLESTFKLVMITVWYIKYIRQRLSLYTLYPFSQLEWPIIMTKQLLIICEWCSYRLIRSIWVWSWLRTYKKR